MDSRCVAHNKLVVSDNELIVNRIQIALKESCAQTEEVSSQLAELTAHVRDRRFQEARDKMISLAKQAITLSSPNKALPVTSTGGTIHKDSPSDPTTNTPLPANTLGVQEQTNMLDLVGQEHAVGDSSTVTPPRSTTIPTESSYQPGDDNPTCNGKDDETGNVGLDDAAEKSPPASSVDETVEQLFSLGNNPPPPPLLSSTQTSKELAVLKAPPTTIEEARNQMKCLQMFEKNS